MPSGFVLEMDPIVGTDFAFDTAASTDGWEAHAIERTSTQFQIVTYQIRVQAAVVFGATQLRLDDWTLAVEAISP